MGLSQRLQCCKKTWIGNKYSSFFYYYSLLLLKKKYINSVLSVSALLGSGRLLLQYCVQQPFQEICGPVRISLEQRYWNDQRSMKYDPTEMSNFCMQRKEGCRGTMEVFQYVKGCCRREGNNNLFPMSKVDGLEIMHLNCNKEFSD